MNVLIVATICLLVGASGTQAASILIENVTLIDGTGRAPISGASVFVKGDRIAAVSPGPIAHEPGVEVIDGTGKFLIPGLIDTHIHLAGGLMRDGKPAFDRQMAVAALHGYLYSGVTAVFDAGNEPDFIFPIREEERSGQFLSPRIFAAGALLTVPGSRGYGVPSMVIADLKTSKPALEAYYKQRRPDLQKVLIDRQGVFVPLSPTPSVALLKNIVTLGKQFGVRTTVHAATEEDFNDALDGGVTVFAHAMRYPSNDTLVARVAKPPIVLSTTMAIRAYFVQLARDSSFLDDPLIQATVDPRILETQRTVEPPKLRVPRGSADQNAFLGPYLAENIKKIHDAGGILAAGTDRTWGASLHMELDLLQKAGIPLLDVVRIATLNGAIYLGRENDLGSIEPGKVADMVLLGADPTRAAKNFQAIEAVFKGGVRVDRRALNVPASPGWLRQK